VELLKSSEEAYIPGIHPTSVIGQGATIDPSASIQPFAVIGKDVTIGARTVVGAHAFVGSGTRIGEDCRIHPNATLREGTVLGSRVVIHSGAVIGSDGFGYTLVEGRHEKIPQLGTVQIDDDVEIGAGTTIDRARFGKTWIQQGTKIDNLVQIAHNVVIGPHCIIIAQTGISGSAQLGRYVTLAGQVGVVGHVTVGDQVTVAAKSGISKDTPAKSTLLGMIGQPIAEERKLMVHYRQLPKTVARLKALEVELAELKAELLRNGTVDKIAGDNGDGTSR
jgi:UDP-3-O-[3-hydroxymyristoyl] glucosamine N-acyltransferase